LGVALVTGLHNPYYTYIFLQFLGFAAVAQLMMRNGWRRIAAPLILCAASLGVVLALQVDTIYYLAVHGKNPEAVQRLYRGLELYALKPLDMFMPAPGHRLDRANALVRAYRLDEARKPLYPGGEFYGEFATFLVDLDLPEDEVMGATGVPLCGDPGWERANRLAELFPLKCVAARGFVRPLRQPYGERRDPDATGIEHLQRIDESLSFDAQELRRGHSTLLENDFTRLTGPHPELVFLLSRAQPCRIAVHDEGGDAATPLSAIGDSHHNHHVAAAPVRDELLGSVQDPTVSIARRRRTHRRRVAPR